MTGLVIVTSGVYTDETLSGIAVTAAAFATVIPWFPIVLSIAAVLFAFSTMISWSYYGERCWTALFGTGSSLIYKLLFLVCVFLGSVFSLGSVLDFSDLMILGMAFPNILGCLLLSGKVRGALDTYLAKLSAGEFKTTK
jgi:AGCS family alanine or glycine:cation symporter